MSNEISLKQNMQLITFENINDLKPNDEIFFYDEKTGTFVKLNTYAAILEEKSKIDSKENEASAKKQSDSAQAEIDGPIGAPKALAVVVLKDKKYKFAFYKLQKKNISIQTGGEAGSNFERISGTQTYEDVWVYVPLFMPRYFDDEHKPKIDMTGTLSIALGDVHASTFNVDHFMSAVRRDENLTTPIALISFDMGDNITYEELERYQGTNFKFTRWITPVKLSNPKCFYVDNERCQMVIQSDIESKKVETDTLSLNKTISEMQPNVITWNKTIADMNKLFEDEKMKVLKQVEDANKPTFFSIKNKRLAKIAKEQQERVTELHKKYLPKIKDATEALAKFSQFTAKKNSLDTQIRAINQPIGKSDIINFGSDHVNPIFFIDSPEMSKNRLLLLVADECKKSKGAVAAAAAGGKCRKYTLQRRRNRGVKKTINKNKKNKKYSSIRIRRKYILRRNNTRRKL